MHSEFDIFPVSNDLSLIAPVGQALWQSLHFLHFSRSILKPTGFFIPSKPITPPTGQRYLHQALFSVNSNSTGKATNPISAGFKIPINPVEVHIPLIGHIEQNIGNLSAADPISAPPAMKYLFFKLLIGFISPVLGILDIRSSIAPMGQIQPQNILPRSKDPRIGIAPKIRIEKAII